MDAELTLKEFSADDSREISIFNRELIHFNFFPQADALRNSNKTHK
jgi:hypothetical protein